MDCIARTVDKIFEETFAFFGLGMVNQSPVLQCILLLIHSLTPAMILVKYLLDGNMFISADPLSKFTDIVELFGPIFMHIIMLHVFFVKRKIFSELQMLKRKLNGLLRDCNEGLYNKIDRERMLFFVLKFLFMQSIGIGIETFQLITLKKTDPNWQYSIQTRVISLNVTRLMIIQFIFFCDLTSSRLKVLNSIRMQILTTDDASEKKISQNLKRIKCLDLEMAKFIQLIREYFKWMLLLIITLDVCNIIIDIYWIYGGLTFANNPNFVQSCCCPWSKIVNIIVLFYSCNEMQKQRDNSLNEIFEWSTDYNDIASSKRRLLLQHFHTSKFILDANGFFYINYGALIGIAEAITTYMVYFFQFMSDQNIFILTIELSQKDKTPKPDEF